MVSWHDGVRFVCDGRWVEAQGQGRVGVGVGDLFAECREYEFRCNSFRFGGAGGVDTVPDLKRGDARVGSGVTTGKEEGVDVV